MVDESRSGRPKPPIVRDVKMEKTVQPSPPLPPPSPEGGAAEPSDILDVKALQSMMDAFFALEHVAMAIVDLRGRVLVATGWQDVCTKFHRVHPEACRHCLESDVALAREAVRAAEVQREAGTTRARLLRERAELVGKSFDVGETPLPDLLRALAAAAEADAALARHTAALGLARARLQQALGLLP